eukprot:TRINITY_DN38295_c0_g1_i1.p1 TRINITY_DN38295_c0_g1~~TRINITY_DN38295_c0_g1_i1.p1  ORF type:complete len:601 (-),score=96.81 TRINITY_DN38295_c0_g1_i1:264-2066(-)
MPSPSRHALREALNDVEMLPKRPATDERVDEATTSDLPDLNDPMGYELSTIRQLLAEMVKKDGSDYAHMREMLKEFLHDFKEEIKEEIRDQMGGLAVACKMTGSTMALTSGPPSRDGHPPAVAEGSASKLVKKDRSLHAEPPSLQKHAHAALLQAHDEGLTQKQFPDEPEKKGCSSAAGSSGGHASRRGSKTSNHSSSSSGSVAAMNSASQALRQHTRRIRHRNRCAVKTWAFFEDPDFFRWGWTYVRVMAIAIMVSAALPFMQAMEPPLLDPSAQGLGEVLLDFAFTLEWVIRFYACPNIIGFLLNPYNLIDALAAIVPLFLRLSQGMTISVTEARTNNSVLLMVLLALMPVLRALKLLRRFQTFHLILKAFRMALEALPMLIYNLTILLLLFGTTIYIVEPSIDMGGAIWLTVVTIGTVGYGDVVPKSTAGIVTVSLLIVVSALYMAIPIGIVGQAFVEVWNDRNRLLLLHRTRTRFATNGYNAKDIPQIFTSFDTDKDGQLSCEEFASMMRSLEIDFSQARIEALFSSFDADKSGALDDKEFVQAIFPWAYSDIYGTVSDTIVSDFDMPQLESPDGADEVVQDQLQEKDRVSPLVCL